MDRASCGKAKSWGFLGGSAPIFDRGADRRWRCGQHRGRLFGAPIIWKAFFSYPQKRVYPSVPVVNVSLVATLPIPPLYAAPVLKSLTLDHLSISSTWVGFVCIVWRSHHPVVLLGFELCLFLQFRLEGWPAREPVLVRPLRSGPEPRLRRMTSLDSDGLDPPTAAPRVASSWGPTRLEFTNFHRARRSVGTRLARACVSRTEEVAAKEKREEDRAERKRIQVRSKILARTVTVFGWETRAQLGAGFVRVFFFCSAL